MAQPQSQIQIKLTINNQDAYISYLNRKAELRAFVDKLMTTEDALKTYIKDTIKHLNEFAEKHVSENSGFGMTKEQIKNQIDLIDDCFYNNITSKEGFGVQLSRNGKLECYTDILDGLLIVLLHLKFRLL